MILEKIEDVLQIFKVKNLNDIKSEVLYRFIEDCKWHYYNSSTPLVSDSIYDTLLQKLKEFGYTEQIGITTSGKILISPSMLSMQSVSDFIKMQRFIKQMISLGCKEILIQRKIDGIAFGLFKHEQEYILHTRGDGKMGEDISWMLPYLFHNKLTFENGICFRGELYISKSAFQIINTKMSFYNPRSVIASLVKLENQEEREFLAKYISIVIFDAISENIKFETEIQKLSFVSQRFINSTIDYVLFPIVTINSLEKIEYWYQKFINEDIPVDGVVLKINEIKIQTLLGNTEHHPKYCLAFKKTSAEHMAIVNKTEITVGRTGLIRLILKLKEVVIIENKKISSLTYFVPLKQDTKIYIELRNGIIPYISSSHSIDKQMIDEFPTHCVFCKSKLFKIKKSIFCRNFLCPERVIKRFEHIFSRLEIPASIGTIRNIQTKLSKTIYEIFEVDFWKYKYTLNSRIKEGVLNSLSILSSSLNLGKLELIIRESCKFDLEEQINSEIHEISKRLISSPINLY